MGNNLIAAFRGLAAQPIFNETEQRHLAQQALRVERLRQDLAYSESEVEAVYTDKWTVAVSGNETAFFQLAEYLMKKEEYKQARQLFRQMPEMDEKTRNRAIGLLR